MEYKNSTKLAPKIVPTDGVTAAAGHSGFNYQDAFSRNIGWVTDWEQQALRTKKVAIAGMGGVGSAHLLVLARLGIGGFSISDLDRYEVANFNRQMGATMATVGRDKVDVMAMMARDINPEVRLDIFSEGVTEENMDSFLAGADLFVDGLDFFAMDIRRAIFGRCAALGIPAITAAPIGFGTAYIVFMPGGMSFEQLFRLDGLPEHRQYVNFATALTPRGLHRSYLADPSRIDLAGKRGPSTGAAVNLCAGVVGAEAVKILLGRGSVKAAPWVHQFDAFRSRWRRSYLPFGNNGPLQSLKRAIGYRMFARMSQNAQPSETPLQGSEIAKIINLARWAPSGDNAQPWRFEIIDGDRFSAQIHVEGEAHNIYDFNDGQPTLISAGFMLETARIAATSFGRRLTWRYVGREQTGHRIEVSAPKDSSVAADPLLPFISTRSVDRTPYRTDKLTAEHKAALEQALGDAFEIQWCESLSDRLRASLLNMKATDIRLRLREAYEVHTRILDWKAPFSTDGVPAASVGLDPLTFALMRWVMRDWRRVAFMNKYLAGTLMPRLQLDLLPGIRCAAHFYVREREQVAQSGTDLTRFLTTGAALQRFWLTATRLGLSLQPGLAPLCFAHYARSGVHATGEATRLEALSRSFDRQFPANPENTLFAGRIGRPAGPSAGRSLRRSLEQLITP